MVNEAVVKMKANTLDLQQEISQASVASGLKLVLHRDLLFALVLAYILGYTAGSHKAVGSGNSAGEKHPTYGRFGQWPSSNP